MISCNFEDGNKASLRHVTVGTIVLNDKNEVLLVKRAARLSRPNTYTIPGGYLDRDENTQQGALRELKEETGLDGEIVMLFKITDKPDRPHEDRQNVDFIYVAKVTGGELTKNDEVTDFSWFSQTSLPEDFAFDHRKAIVKYFEYLKNPFAVPIVESL